MRKGFKEVEIFRFNNWDIELPVEDALKFISKQIIEAENKGYTKLNFDHSSDYDDNSILVLKGTRLETDEEYNDRIKFEKKQEERRFRQYEELKKEFEHHDNDKKKSSGN